MPDTKSSNEQNPPPISLAPDMTYSGWGTPNHLFYDGHPGIDYEAAMDTQVYAAVSGTIHYPARIVGLGYPAAGYHVMEIVPDHAAGTVPPYVFYYLHLDTYVGQQQMPVTDPDPRPGCAATVWLPLDEGAHVQAGCLVALSGKAAPPIYHFLPHLHFEVHDVVPSFLVFSRFGARVGRCLHRWHCGCRLRLCSGRSLRLDGQLRRTAIRIPGWRLRVILTICLTGVASQVLW